MKNIENRRGFTTLKSWRGTEEFEEKDVYTFF